MIIPTLHSRTICILLIFSVGSVIFLSSCGESEESILSPSAYTETVTYGDVASIITLRCGICHNGGGTEPEFGSFANLRNTANNVLEVMKNGSMPPGGPRISPDELLSLENWIKQGKEK